VIFGTLFKFVFSEIRTEPSVSHPRRRRRRRRNAASRSNAKCCRAQPEPLCLQLSTPCRSQFAKMSLPKPFSQCSLSDLAPAISAHASATSARALDPATADRLLPVLFNTALTEAILLRHPLVRDRSGLKCDGSVYSKRVWCGMLRNLVGAAGVDVSDAALLRVYLVCKECAKLERAQLWSGSPASAAAEDGGALAASPAPAAAPRTASSSLSATRLCHCQCGRARVCASSACRPSPK
jgi:hypothetical protein